jgi:hypothetical protein
VPIGGGAGFAAARADSAATRACFARSVVLSVASLMGERASPDIDARNLVLSAEEN